VTPIGPLDDVAHPVYSLRLGGEYSDQYYADVARFADELLAEVDLQAAALIAAYSRDLKTAQREPPRSSGEYAIDLLALGLAQWRYAGVAENTPDWAIALALEFEWLGRRYWSMRPIANLLSAMISRFFMGGKVGEPLEAAVRSKKRRSRPGPTDSLARLPHLIEWLIATGNFNQETMRLDGIRIFLSSLPEAEAEVYLDSIAELFRWFLRESNETLGSYTQDVKGFLTKEYPKRGWREDRGFCCKVQAEYHLGMVAAEIMNRAQRKHCEGMPQKAVLVPACLRGAHALNCQADICGTEVTCMACDPDCRINRVRSRVRSIGAMVYLMPNCGDCERLLERWRYQTDTAVTALTCIPNILELSLEMRARGIASQVLPLDYPGCGSHWGPTNVTSDLNEEHLVQILVSGSRKAP
jgi:hypothetical protein